MKYILVLFALMTGIFQAQAQKKILLEAGTDVPVVSALTTNAFDLKEGQMIELKTASAVTAESGEVLIPEGSRVMARVRTGLKQRILVDQRRRLIIDIKSVLLPDGTKVALCDGVASFTVYRNTGDLDAVPLKEISARNMQIPTDYVMHAKVEVSQTIYK
jgi:hypothetical protein